MNVANPKDPKLKKLVEMIGCFEPNIVQVDVRKPEYHVGRCWFNAYDAAQGKHENILHGWLFWEDEGSVFGQHHAVVRDENQSSLMVDVTPNASNQSAVLFAESPLHKFDFQNLKGWVNVRCDDANQVIVKQLDIRGMVINKYHKTIARTRQQPDTADLEKIRTLCPIAGSGR